LASEKHRRKDDSSATEGKEKGISEKNSTKESDRRIYMKTPVPIHKRRSDLNLYSQASGEHL
jgi:hypothetical protein